MVAWFSINSPYHAVGGRTKPRRRQKLTTTNNNNCVSSSAFHNVPPMSSLDMLEAGLGAFLPDALKASTKDDNTQETEPMSDIDNESKAESTSSRPERGRQARSERCRDRSQSRLRARSRSRSRLQDGLGSQDSSDQQSESLNRRELLVKSASSNRRDLLVKSKSSSNRSLGLITSKKKTKVEVVTKCTSAMEKRLVARGMAVPFEVKKTTTKRPILKFTPTRSEPKKNLLENIDNDNSQMTSGPRRRRNSISYRMEDPDDIAPQPQVSNRRRRNSISSKIEEQDEAHQPQVTSRRQRNSFSYKIVDPGEALQPQPELATCRPRRNSIPPRTADASEGDAPPESVRRSNSRRNIAPDSNESRSMHRSSSRRNLTDEIEENQSMRRSSSRRNVAENQDYNRGSSTRRSRRSDDNCTRSRSRSRQNLLGDENGPNNCRKERSRPRSQSRVRNLMSPQGRQSSSRNVVGSKDTEHNNSFASIIFLSKDQEQDREEKGDGRHSPTGPSIVPAREEKHADPSDHPAFSGYAMIRGEDDALSKVMFFD